MSRFSRREFLVRSSAAAVAAGVGVRYAPVLAREVPPIKVSAGTDVVTLGKSGIKTTVLGIGTGIVPRSLEKEEDEHDVSWKPFIGTLRVKARPGEPDQHLEASLAR